MNGDGKEFTRIFDSRMAEEIGLNESIVLNQLCYWISVNEKAGRNYRDGMYWTYNTFEQWHQQFPWWSVPTIKRIFAKLENGGFILTGRFNEKNYDQTRWYTVVFEKLLPYMDSPSYQNDTIESINLISPIPENNSREYSKEISGMVDCAERIDNTHAPDPAVSERPVYPHVQTIDPKKRITRKMCVELFGEPATEDAKTLVDNYIDRYYPKYRGAQHPEVSHAARYAYAYRLLLCSVEMGQRSLELVDDALLCAVRKEKGYDPTIYLVTRPHALGHWMLQCGDMTFDLICGERYDFVNNTTPDLDPFPVRQAEVFREEYTGSNYK